MVFNSVSFDNFRIWIMVDAVFICPTMKPYAMLNAIIHCALLYRPLVYTLFGSRITNLSGLINVP